MYTIHAIVRRSGLAMVQRKEDFVFVQPPYDDSRFPYKKVTEDFVKEAIKKHGFEKENKEFFVWQEVIKYLRDETLKMRGMISARPSDE